MIHRCEVQAEDLGALLLDQLTPTRARTVARQVAACPLCAQEAVLLGPVVTALRAYPPPAGALQEALQATGRTTQPGDVPEPSSPAGPAPEALGAVLAEVRAERGRRWRRRAVVTAAAAVLAVGAPAATLLTRSPDPTTTSSDAIDVRLTGAAATSGRATLDGRRWGTAIRLEVRGLDPGARYGVWLAAADGGRQSAGSFRTSDDGTVDLRLSAALPLSAGRVLGVSRLPVEAGEAVVDVLQAPLA